MSQPAPRSIPLAAAALSLSFGGACTRSHVPADAPPVLGGGDDGPPGGGTPIPPVDGSGQALDAVAQINAEAYCDSRARCYPGYFATYLGGSQASCVRYYDYYFSSYYSYLLDVARDPVACESALIDLIECYGEYYAAPYCSNPFADCRSYGYYYDPYYGVGYYYTYEDYCGPNCYAGANLYSACR